MTEGLNDTNKGAGTDVNEGLVYIRMASNSFFPALFPSLPRFPQRTRDSPHCQIVYKPRWVSGKNSPNFPDSSYSYLSLVT